MDGAYVAVKFPGTSSNANCQSSSNSDPDPSSLLQDCRLLRIDELQVCIREILKMQSVMRYQQRVFYCILTFYGCF